MRVASIVPVKGETVEAVARVISTLPHDVEPWVMWHGGRPRAASWRAASYIDRRCVSVDGEWSGPGAAYRAGIERALDAGIYTHVMMYDSDGDMDADAVVPMLASAQTHDLVVASRWTRRGGFRGYPLGKLLANAAGNALARAVLAAPISDLTFGQKIIAARYAEMVIEFAESDDHGFYAESTMLPIALGARAAQVPAVWRGRRDGVATLDVRAAIDIYARALVRALRVKCAR